DFHVTGVQTCALPISPALRLARLLLANLTLVDQRGATSASSFMVDMNRLFERFVTERLRRALQGRLEVRDQTRAHLGVGNRVLKIGRASCRERVGRGV